MTYDDEKVWYELLYTAYYLLYIENDNVLLGFFFAPDRFIS